MPTLGTATIWMFLFRLVRVERDGIQQEGPIELGAGETLDRNSPCSPL